MLPGSERADLETFSPRERQIIAAITAAQQGRDLAGALRLSPQTARSYNKDIYERAEVQSTRPLMPQFVPGDLRADLRNQALHRTLAASDTAQLQRATLALLGAWTGVRRLWDWEIYADGISGLPSRLASRLRSAPVPVWINPRLLLSATLVSQSALLRAAAVTQSQANGVLTLLQLAERRWLVALADPPGGSFTADAIMSVAALVRMAEHHAESFRSRKARAVAASSQRRAVCS